VHVDDGAGSLSHNFFSTPTFKNELAQPYLVLYLNLCSPSCHLQLVTPFCFDSSDLKFLYNIPFKQNGVLVLSKIN
jgi:hypothetical protein